MAQAKISINLSSAAFSFSPTFKGPSVIQGQLDQNYYQATAGFAGDTPQRGINIPQMYYCENTVPTAEGYRSVAYKFFIEPPETQEQFVKVITVFDGNASSALIGVTADRKLFIVSAFTDGLWEALELPVGYGWDEATDITSTTINGIVALCLRGVGIFQILVPSSSLSHISITGLDEEDINGICSTAGYLVVWTDYIIYWSSTADPFDFVPSLITGAGSAQPVGLKGAIVLCKELSNGFIVYGEVSILSAAYSANLAFPWVFAPLQTSGGIRNADAVGYSNNMLNHFAYTSGGFIAVELHQAIPVFPELTDYIASGVNDVTTGLTSPLTSEFIGVDRTVRISSISNRYICVSVGTSIEGDLSTFDIPQMTQSFVWDTQLKRWGRLLLDHAQVFEAPFAATPPVFYYTTRPYPVEFSDTLESNQATVVAGLVRGQPKFSDVLDSSQTSVNYGSMRNLYKSYVGVPEDLISSQIAVESGDMRTKFQSYAMEPEAVESTQVSMEAGTLDNILIRYSRWTPESLNSTQVTVQSGGLTNV